MKIVISTCHGGFGISEAGMLRYAEIKGLTVYPEKDSPLSGLIGPTFWLLPKGQRPNQDDFWSLSVDERIASNKAMSAAKLEDREIRRDDPVLVQIVEELGDEASGRFASLKIVDIPDDVDWTIEEYDGAEWVAEVHRTWS